MKNHKFAALAAALALGTMLGTPVFSALSQDVVSAAEGMVAAGDVDAFLGLVAAHPELASMPGVLGDSIRSFQANPTSANLAAVNAIGLSSVGTTAAASQTSGVNSIY